MRRLRLRLVLLAGLGLLACDAQASGSDGGEEGADVGPDAALAAPRDAAGDPDAALDAAALDAAVRSSGPCPMPPPEGYAYQVGVSVFGDNDYIEYMPGDLPIIIGAPHGGTLTPENMPPDDGLARDSGSQETALAVRARFLELTGRAPHVVINHVARNRLNLARVDAQPNADVPEAMQAYEEFHAFIETASAWVTASCGSGHYFDFHTKGGDGQPIDVGTGLTAARLSLDDQGLADEASSSYYGALASRPGVSFVETVRGPTSIGGLLDAYDDVTARPSPREPTPVGQFFIGGFNPSRHSAGVIDATHLEMHFRYINAGAEVRQTFSIRLTDVISTFVETHYGFDLDA